MRKVKIRGLIVIAGTIFLIWGAIVGIKGLYDAFFGEPEANFFSLTKWEFVTRAQWLRWSGFELVYGLSAIALGLYLRRLSAKFAEYREKKENE
jgi:hypothetical protein